MTFSIVFIYQQQKLVKHFNSSIAQELMIFEESGWGNNIYLFVTENFLLLVDLLKNNFYIFR